VLLLQTLGSLHRQPLGYDPSGVLALDLDLPARRFPTAESRVRLIHAIEEKVRAVPGVVAVGSTRALPLESGGPDTEFRIQGRPPDASNSQGWAYYTSISSQYLKAMGVSLLAGRHLEEADDRSGAPQVAVINQALAKKYWPDGSAVGQRLEMGPWKVEVVGVVRDLRQRFLRDDVQPQMFLPYTMEPTLQVSMVVRTAGDPSAVVPALHRAVWDVDPNLPLEEWTMDALMRMATAQSRLTTMMVGAFAGLAILLALIGVYGVVSYGVSLRRHELGVRMALGATRVRVLTLVLSKGVALGGIGIALGTAGAIGVARGFQGLLFGVGPADPATLAASAIAIAAVTLAASLIPALRAARLDPLVALRTE
jgi:putative ABC transport system permease protein